jgi:hypothetical protein
MMGNGNTTKYFCIFLKVNDSSPTKLIGIYTKINLFSFSEGKNRLLLKLLCIITNSVSERYCQLSVQVSLNTFAVLLAFINFLT